MPLVEGVSSSLIRTLAHDGDVRGAAQLLGRPSSSTAPSSRAISAAARSAFRPRTSRVDPEVLVPEYGIYAGAVGDRRAAISIGVNPHYGGTERRIEAYLLDWHGDLYGDRLVVELWARLARSERRDGRPPTRGERSPGPRHVAPEVTLDRAAPPTAVAAGFECSAERHRGSLTNTLEMLTRRHPLAARRSSPAAAPGLPTALTPPK